MKTFITAILRFLGKHIIQKYHPEVIGITGSVGKTGVKEAARQILSRQFRVYASTDSYNTDIGVALTILGEKSPGHSLTGWLRVIARGARLWLLRSSQYPEIVLLEMGADRPGDIQHLTAAAPCSVGVVTAITPVHLSTFKTVEKIARETRAVITHLPRTGIAVLNRDDELVHRMQGKTDADIITFGFHADADVRGSDVQFRVDSDTGWPAGIQCKVTSKGSMVPLYIPGVVGEQAVYAVLAAIAIALSQGMNLVEISKAVQRLDLPPGRMRLIPGIKDTLLLDDTYNASPASVRAAIETLSQISVHAGARRCVVLGDMLELGKYTDDAHREAGLRIAEHEFDLALFVGEAMKTAARAAREAGMEETRAVSFSHQGDAGRFLQEWLRQGDVVLVKGSRAMRMEAVVKEVMASPLHAQELLVH